MISSMDFPSECWNTCTLIKYSKNEDYWNIYAYPMIAAVSCWLAVKKSLTRWYSYKMFSTANGNRGIFTSILKYSKVLDLSTSLHFTLLVEELLGHWLSQPMGGLDFVTWYKACDFSQSEAFFVPFWMETNKKTKMEYIN